MRGPHHTRSSHLLHGLGDWSSKAVAGVTTTCLLAGWCVVGIIARFPSWWQVALYSTTSAVTVVMVFAIQHTQHREQVVTQRKLDELLRAQPGADDRLIAAEAHGRRARQPHRGERSLTSRRPRPRTVPIPRGHIRFAHGAS